MFGWFKKQYVLEVEMNNCKEAELVGNKEGYGTVNINSFNEDLLINHKVSLTIPRKRTYFGITWQARQYSKKGIFHVIKKQPFD